MNARRDWVDRCLDLDLLAVIVLLAFGAGVLTPHIFGACG